MGWVAKTDLDKGIKLTIKVTEKKSRMDHQKIIIKN